MDFSDGLINGQLNDSCCQIIYVAGFQDLIICVSSHFY